MQSKRVELFILVNRPILITHL